MTVIDQYLVRAHQQDLLRAACLRRPGSCSEPGRLRLRRSRFTA